MGPLFKLDSKNKIRVWDVELESETGRYRTVAGLKEGNKVISEWTTPTAKNVGKANELSAAEQGLIEVTAMFVKKRKEGYVDDINDVEKPLGFVKPMLAESYKDHFKGKFPVFVQPKLDGFRCILTKDGAFTRKGEQYRAIPHIEKTFANFFKQYPEAILDGELYNHDLKEDFQKIQKLLSVNKTLTPEDLVETEKLVQFHIYDTPSIGNLSYQHRYDGLGFMFEEFREIYKHSERVHTRYVRHQEDLDAFHAKALEEGYEGTMIRLNTLYQNKRTKDLLKRKEFQDAEFPIESIDEGIGNLSGMAGRVTCRLPNGDKFGAGIKGGRSVNKQLWEERDILPGKMATIRFFRYTNTGIPLLPVFHSVREIA